MKISHGMGLLPKTGDSRDLSCGQVFSQPRIEDIPEELMLNVLLTQKDQKESDFCSMFAGTSAIEYTEKVPLCPEFSFALGKMIEGKDPESFGLEIRDAAKVLVKFGALEAKDSPYSLENHSASFLRNIANWGKDIVPLLNKAIVHKQGSYLDIKGRYDPFDNAKTWFAARKSPILFGVFFGEVVDGVMQPGGEGGHAMIVVGYKKDALIAQNSYGDYLFRFAVPREVFNRGYGTFGGIQFSDLTPEEARFYAENGIKKDGDFLDLMLAYITRLMRLLKKMMAKKQELGAVPSPTLRMALLWQESQGMDNAIGDDGHAYGPLQIWQSYMTDALPGRRAEECLGNRPLSWLVFDRYMARYATQKQVGHTVTDQDIARIHNGGPIGWRKPQTLVYWYQVRDKMNRILLGDVPSDILKRITL